MTAKKYWVSRGGETSGPYMVGQLLRMWDSGNITHEDHMCQVEMEDWLPADQVVGWLQEDREQYAQSPVPPPLSANQRGAIHVPSVKKKSNAVLIVVLTVLFLLAAFFEKSILSGPGTMKELMAVDRWSRGMGSEVQHYGKKIVTVNGLRCWRLGLADGRTFLVVLKNEEIHSYRPWEDFLKDRKAE